MNNPGNAVIARAAANARQGKGYALRGRNLRPGESSWGDPMKVAQHEVLGWRSEKATSLKQPIGNPPWRPKTLCSIFRF